MAAVIPPAVAVFATDAELPWLRVLRPGFRHCFALVWDGGAWVLCDPLAHATEVRRVPSARVGETAQAVAAWFTARGYRALIVPARRVPRVPAPWAPLTCVEVVKRVLGIRARLAITPWGLYRRLLAAGAEPPIGC